MWGNWMLNKFLSSNWIKATLMLNIGKLRRAADVELNNKRK